MLLISLADVMRIIHERCFPNLINPTSLQYIEEWNKDEHKIFDEFEKVDKAITDNDARVATPVGRLAIKLLEFDAPTSGFDLITEIYSDVGFDSFRIRENRSAVRWFNGSTGSMHEGTLYRASVFYAYGLIKLANCEEYIRFFFDSFEINLNVDRLLDCAKLLDWEEDIVLFITYILLGCNKGTEWLESKLYLLREYINNKMRPVEAAIEAEKCWLNDVSSFSPRTIEDTVAGLAMQDFYVQSEFKTQGIECPEPIQRMARAKNSTRQLILGRTGMGKSMYIRMASLCIGRHLLNQNDKIDELAKKMETPDNIYVIYVPAYMFSYCFKKTEYRSWTDDFITLYFNCIFTLSGSINFDKRELRNPRICPECLGYEITKELIQYITALANEGRLLLLADSFDEIPSGEMRNAYLITLRSFYTKYCDCPEKKGAHTIVTSRKMSLSTMRELANSIGIKLASQDVVEIQPLSKEQQEELILNWDRQFIGKGIKENIRRLNNHFFNEIASNPYMLSIFCLHSGAGINEILASLIKNIMIYRMQQAVNALENDLLKSVLNSTAIQDILQKTAFKTVQESTPHFSLDIVAPYIQSKLSGLELSDDEYEYCYNVIISLFATAVGLIVPADNEDDNYQFIADSIRYELAVSRIADETKKYASIDLAVEYCTLKGQLDDKEYVNLMIPLICKVSNMRNIPLAEALIRNLVLRSYKKENEWLINRSMIDLVLERYGLNITCLYPNKSSSNYQYCLSADRLIMMRLLSAPNFMATASEKKSLVNSNAFKVCEGFINDFQKNLLK